MNIRNISFYWLFFSVLATSLCGQAQNAERLRSPVPGKTEERVAQKLVNEIFEEQIGDRSLEAQKKLSSEMLKLGLETNDDPTSRYVLLRESFQVAQKVGLYSVAWKACDALEKHYQIDCLAQRFQLLKSASSSNDGSSMTSMLELFTPIVQRSSDANQFERAISIVKKLNTVVRKSSTPAVRAQMKRTLDQLKSLQRSYKELEDEFKRQTADPEDAGANQKVGEFYCFEKGDFEMGLPMLAKGDDAYSSQLASAELELPPKGASAELVTEIAEGWLKMADHRESEPAREHAFQLLLSAEKSASGVSKKLIQSKLAKHFGTARIIIEKLTKNDWAFPWKTGRWNRVSFRKDGTLTITMSGENLVRKWTQDGDSILLSTSKPIRIFLNDDRPIARKYVGTKVVDEVPGKPIK